MQKQHIYAVQAFALCLLETVAESGPSGAPSGVMYAAVVGKVTLSQFQQVMGQMESKGFLTQEEDCYTITPKGLDFLPKLKSFVDTARKELETQGLREAVPA